MRILKEIIEQLDGYDPEQEYFEFDIGQRNRIVSVLWDNVYGDYYKKSLRGKTQETPLKVQLDILMYLLQILQEHEEKEQFELCDVVQRLIEITEHKISELDEHYANSIKKTNRE